MKRQKRDISGVDDLYAISNNFYNGLADKYNQQMEVESGARLQVAEYLKTHATGKHIMDFGGGTGLDLPWLKESFDRILFCEVSSLMREQACELVTVNQWQNQVRILDKELVDFRNWGRSEFEIFKVDCILSNFAVVNSIPDLELLFERWFQILKPQGTVFMVLLDPMEKVVIKKYFIEWFKAVLKGQKLTIQVSSDKKDFRPIVYEMRHLRKMIKDRFEIIDSFKVSNDHRLLHFKKLDI